MHIHSTPIQGTQVLVNEGLPHGFSWIHDVTNPCEGLSTNHTLPRQHHMDPWAHITN